MIGVGSLLRSPGPLAEPLRRDLAVSPEPRLRLRALMADGDGAAQFLADPAPLVRAEAVGITADVETLLPFLADPDPRVRWRACYRLAGAAVGSEPFLTAARTETDPLVRTGLVWALARRPDEPGVRVVLVGFLADVPSVAREAINALYRVDDPGVTAAFASRILVGDDLPGLLRHQYLMKQVRQLRDLLERLHAPARVLTQPDGTPTTADLEPEQRDRLLAEVMRWAEAALAPAADTVPLQTWLEEEAEPQGMNDGRSGVGGRPPRMNCGQPPVVGDLPGPDGDHPEGGDDSEAGGDDSELGGDLSGVVGDCLRHALAGDLPRAMDAGVRAAAAAAMTETGDPHAAGWAAELTRLAHEVTATQIRCGLEPLPPGQVRHFRAADAEPVLMVRLADRTPVALAFQEPAPTSGPPEQAVRRIPARRAVFHIASKER